MDCVNRTNYGTTWNTAVMQHLANGGGQLGLSRRGPRALPGPALANIICYLVPMHNADALFQRIYLHTVLLGQGTPIEFTTRDNEDTSHIIDNVLDYLYCGRRHRGYRRRK